MELAVTCLWTAQDPQYPVVFIFLVVSIFFGFANLQTVLLCFCFLWQPPAEIPEDPLSSLVSGGCALGELFCDLAGLERVIFLFALSFGFSFPAAGWKAGKTLPGETLIRAWLLTCEDEPCIAQCHWGTAVPVSFKNVQQREICCQNLWC